MYVLTECVGLRTLCFAERRLSRDEFDEWFTQYNHAQSALVNRKEKIDAAAKLIECDLQLLGATGTHSISLLHPYSLLILAAIEDKLQDFVPQALESFIRVRHHTYSLTYSLTDSRY